MSKESEYEDRKIMNIRRSGNLSHDNILELNIWNIFIVIFMLILIPISAPVLVSRSVLTPTLPCLYSFYSVLLLLSSGLFCNLEIELLFSCYLT
jgi:hypothetical protein